MKLLSFLVRQSPAILLFSLIAGVLNGAAGAALLSLINQAIQQGANLTVLGIAFAGGCIVVALTRVSSHLSLIRLGEDTVLKMRVDLVRRILATPLAKLEAIGTNRMLAALTEDTASISGAAGHIPGLVINVLVVACSLAYLAWLSPHVLLAFLVVLAVAAITYISVVQQARDRYSKAGEQQDRLFGHFRVLCDGGKELKLHAGRRSGFAAVIDQTATSLRDQYVSGASVAGIGQTFGQLMVFFTVGYLIFVLPQFQSVDRATLTAYTLVLFYIMGPFQALLQSTRVLGRGAVALERVEKLGLSLKAAPARSVIAAPPAWRRLELSGVTYTYDRGRGADGFSLGPLDLVFEPGQVIFLVGGNGSGKTTLAKIISGLYQPDRGEIRVDHAPVTEANIEGYRELFSTVFADFCLFDSFVGLHAGDLEQRVSRYLTRLLLDGKVSIENGALSTTDLSQGQRKRLALLTAYLEDRPIYIFDEWAADQDPSFKRVFYQEVLAELKARGKTVFVISHDDRYFGFADRVVKLEDGRLVTYEEIPRTVVA